MVYKKNLVIGDKYLWMIGNNFHIITYIRFGNVKLKDPHFVGLQNKFSYNVPLFDIGVEELDSPMMNELYEMNLKGYKKIFNKIFNK